MFRVKLTHRAEKDLKKLDKRYFLKVSQSIDLLSTNPFLGEKMGGEYKGSYRIKIPPIRIIYIPDIINKTILIKAIGHRQGVYK